MIYAATAALLLGAPFATVAAMGKASLQWSICDPTPQDVLPKLGIKSTTPPYKENPITFYDELPPYYTPKNYLFRTKITKGQPLSSVKARFLEETDDVPDFVECSWYRYGNNSTYTCEKTCPRDPDSSQLWCDQQVEFAERYEDIGWSSLTPYGPYPNGKWKVRVEGYKAKFDDVAIGSLHLMEIEAYVPMKKADHAFEKITNYLKEQGVVLCDTQQGKAMRMFHAMGLIGNGREEL